MYSYERKILNTNYNIQILFNEEYLFKARFADFKHL